MFYAEIMQLSCIPNLKSTADFTSSWLEGSTLELGNFLLFKAFAV